MNTTVWVFVGDKGTQPSGIFTTEALAEEWIKKHSLTGILTEYPVDLPVYDLALSNGWLKINYPSQSSPDFIGRFSSAYLRHNHYEGGRSAEGASAP